MRQKLSLALLVLLFILGATLLFLLAKVKALQEQYSISMNNYKVYEQMMAQRLDSVNAYNYQLKLTKEQLKYSNDSIIQHLNEVRKQLKIKDKNLQQMQYVGTVTTRTDSIFVTDTIFTENIHVDTTLRDEWRELNLKLDYPNKISVNSKFNNKLSVIVSTEKQTINPPSKIFFIRWFQKKHNMVKIDVIDANPYAAIKENRFIKIIK